ncbi:hypothetical protein [Enterococcus sp. RIT-PI-f]|uniref:hypothetical protein n=1 Tax=Enterococcus sp. RIT-PI-f TaxID=1690244 RepID=UPI0006B9D5A9|nr:hypothetical protein [Enterococcus sp. RIT-PI-f]KPG70851.1 hypothetical protein AEQ18_06620 [Enterococcus sp. RIT-PI-f]
MSYQRLSGILMLILLGSWGIIGWFYFHPQILSEAVNEPETVSFSTENSEIKSSSNDQISSENQTDQAPDNGNTGQSNEEKTEVVTAFVTTYFNTNDQPFLKERVSLLKKNELITEEYGNEMDQSIGDMDNEDAKMNLDGLTIYSNDQETFLVVFDLTYEGLDSNEVLVYVANVHVGQTNQVDHYELVATNTKIKTGE